MTNKYSAFYYPDCYIDSPSSLATYLLLYDEIHLVALSDDAKNPTEYFSKLPKYTTIKAIAHGREVEYLITADEIRTKKDQGEIDEQTKRVILFYQFIQRNKELIGSTIFYHPNILASATNRITSKLLREGLPNEEFLKFLTGDDEEIHTLEEYRKNYPTIQDEVLWRIVPTATKIAKERDYVLISDVSDIPVSILSTENKSVRNLTSILAEECIKLYIPSCIDATPEEILEVRQELKGLIIPFRMSLQRLSKDLKSAIDAQTDIENIRREAKFIVESQVEPAAFELKKKIEQANSKLLTKVFGKMLSWCPLIVKAFALPTLDNILKAVKQVTSESEPIMESLDNIAYSCDQGLCFLLQVNEKLGKPK